MLAALYAGRRDLPYMAPEDCAGVPVKSRARDSSIGDGSTTSPLGWHRRGTACDITLYQQRPSTIGPLYSPNYLAHHSISPYVLNVSTLLVQ